MATAYASVLIALSRILSVMGRCRFEPFCCIARDFPGVYSGPELRPCDAPDFCHPALSMWMVEFSCVGLLGFWSYFDL